MKKGQFIGGIICLAVAGLLVVANIRLPEEDVLFAVGNINMPYLPPSILAVVGIVLIATAKKRKVKTIKY